MKIMHQQPRGIDRLSLVITLYSARGLSRDVHIIERTVKCKHGRGYIYIYE
jgi:hypothetical protein